MRWIRLIVVLLLFWTLSACTSGPAPKFTLLSHDEVATTTTTGAASWPELSTWDVGTQRSNDVAVIIAIEEYAFLPDVEGAVRNATDWESYFRRARGMSEVYVLTNQEATAEEIRRFVDQAASNAAEDSTIWFVFIGHGAASADGDDGLLIGMDAQQTVVSIASRSVPRKELVERLEKGSHANSVMILDTCFSGRDTQGELLAQGTQPVIPVTAPPPAQSRTVILSAAGHDQVAGQLPGEARPAFSYMLLGAMRGWASDGEPVTADLATSWVRQQFRHLRGRQQTPSVEGNAGIVLASNIIESDPGVSELMQGKRAVRSSVVIRGERYDTHRGLIFTKPEGWALGPIPRFGYAILTLSHMFDGSEMWVERMAMDEGRAASMFSSYHSGNSRLDSVRQIAPPTPVDYGSVPGIESEYEESEFTHEPHDFGGAGFDDEFFEEDPVGAQAPTRATYRLIRFETWQAGAAWRVTLRLGNQDNREERMESFRQLAASLEYYGEAQ